MPEILIIEDDEATQGYFRRALEHLGRIELVERGDLGIVKLDEQHYDIVLLDLNLPGANGATVLEHLERPGPNQKTPVLVISAHIGGEHHQPHATFLVEKPVRLHVLVNLVAAVLKRDPHTGAPNAPRPPPARAQARPHPKFFHWAHGWRPRRLSPRGAG